MPMRTSELTCRTITRAAAAGSPTDREELDAVGQAYSRLGPRRAPPTRRLATLGDSTVFPASHVLDGQTGA
jgi:hypothetical protein